MCWKVETLLCWQRSIESRQWSSQWSWMIVRAGLSRRQNTKELIPSNCGAGEGSWESLAQQDQTKLKGSQPWILIGRTDAWAETPVFWSSDVNSQLIGKLPTSGEERAEGEEGVRGWNGWMASLRQWTWTWANFGRWWGTQSPGVLQSMESQRVRHDWATEQQQLLLVSLDLKMVVLLNWLCQRLWLRRSQQTVENS